MQTHTGLKGVFCKEIWYIYGYNLTRNIHSKKRSEKAKTSLLWSVQSSQEGWRGGLWTRTSGGKQIHNVFHVSNLKKTVGQHIAPSTELPPLDDEGILVLILERIIQVRERKLRNRAIQEYLVKWKELPTEDATWEGEQVLQHPSLQLLEDKQYQAGRTVMSSSN